jgi:hypothetical protein
MRGAWTAVRRIVVPVAWKTASNEAVKVRAAVADQELDVLELLAEGEGEVAGLLHGPLAGRMCSDTAQVHPAGAMLDEHQDIQAFEQHGVDVQEVHGENPGSLGAQELPPRGLSGAAPNRCLRRAGSPRRWTE